MTTESTPAKVRLSEWLGLVPTRASYALATAQDAALGEHAW
jgi:hypothetical protein